MNSNLLIQRVLREPSRTARNGILSSVIAAVLFGTLTMSSAVVIAADQTSQTRSTGEEKGLLTNSMRTRMPDGLYKASKLIGANIKDKNGESIGEIVDLALETSQRQVNYAVLSFGGTLGVGDKLFAVPLSAFETGKDRDELILSVTQDRLKTMQGFDDDKWPTDISTNWPASKANIQGSVKTSSTINVVKAKQYLDYEVKNPQGKELGEIDDLAVDLQKGTIKYVVIEHGGLLGIGEKLVAVPSSTLAPGIDKDEVILNTTETELKNAKGFSEDNWPIAANSISDLEYDTATTFNQTTQQGKTSMVYSFPEIDGDSNGYVTKMETSHMPDLQRRYDSLDKNRDGKLDRAEFARFEAAHKDDMPARKAP